MLPHEVMDIRMLILKVILSLLLMTAGLYATSCRFTPAERVFNSPIYHRAGILITTIFLIALLWQ